MRRLYLAREIENGFCPCIIYRDGDKFFMAVWNPTPAAIRKAVEDFENGNLEIRFEISEIRGYGQFDRLA